MHKQSVPAAELLAYSAGLEPTILGLEGRHDANQAIKAVENITEEKASFSNRQHALGMHSRMQHG